MRRPIQIARAQSSYAQRARPPALLRTSSAPATLYTRADAVDVSRLAATLRELRVASSVLSADERSALKAQLLDQYSLPNSGAAERRSRAWGAAAAGAAANEKRVSVVEVDERDDAAVSAGEIVAELEVLREIFDSDELTIAGTRRIKLKAVTHAFSASEQLNARQWMTLRACRDFGASAGALERLLLGNSSTRHCAEEPDNEVHLSIVLTADYPHAAPLVQVEGRGVCRFTAAAHGLAAAIEAKAAELVGAPMLFNLLCLAQEHVATVSETMAGGRGEAVIEVLTGPWGECYGTRGMATLYEAWEKPYRDQITALRSALDASSISLGSEPPASTSGTLDAKPNASASASSSARAKMRPPALRSVSATQQHTGKRAARQQARGVSLPDARHAVLAAVPPSLLEPQALVGSLHDLFDRIPECVALIGVAARTRARAAI